MELNIGNDRTGLEIAVIGMAGRFPGAKNIHEFWENLVNGKESISFFSDEELKESGVEPGLLNNSRYVRAFGWLEDIEYFDSSFFGYTPLEAEIMDPQVRIFHECAFAALEDAGHDAYTTGELVGVYAGASACFYWQVLVEMSGKNDILGRFASKQLNDKDFMATRLAYRLNLKGPAVAVDTACSTSLVAIHMACQGLLSGDCDMALAGGATIIFLKKEGYLQQEGMVHSPDGHCRAFALGASGSNFGNGVGIVVLKRLGDALENGDHIYAIIRGSSINNDGTGKAAYTAPGVEGQAAVIKTAHRMAEVDPGSITYVETHGTGTILGDQVEIEALRLAFNSEKRHFCRIGSVKTNVGHLETAAGVAGFIKTVLALKHRLIPPSLHVETSNPKIDFETSPFCVNTGLTEWKRDKYPLRAGVSSFGIGGTNAHVILEEWPEDRRSDGQRTDGRPQLILLSARTQFALDRMTENLVNHLKENPGINLADAAHTLLAGRSVFKHRRMAVCPDVRGTIDMLSPPFSGKVKTFCSDEDNRPVVFIFSGLGSQYVNMGLDLYRSEAAFREEMNRCFEILGPLVDFDLKEILYPSSGNSSQEGRGAQSIGQPEISQVVIFVFEYALAQLLIRWGIKPDAMIGYSFGEYVAACTAGVFSLEDALKLVVLRGRLIRRLPAGAMLSVPLSREELTPLLNDELSLSIDNGTSCIVAGPTAAIGEFENRLKQKKYLTMRLEASRAIHSRMMAPIAEELEEQVSRLRLGKPAIPYVSNVTGNWMTDEEAADPGYWGRHLRETVQFAAGMKELLKETNSLFIEIGPGRDISTLALRYLEEHEAYRLINLVRHPHQQVSDVYFLLDKIGKLWLYGQKIAWNEFNSGEKRQRVPLPPYPFERQRYWIDTDLEKMSIEALHKRAHSEKQPDVADWFYIPTWIRHVMLPTVDKSGPGPHNYLVFPDDRTNGPAVLSVKRLEQQGHNVITVERGTAFIKKNAGAYVINPQQTDDYYRLFNELNSLGITPTHIVHMWGITAADPGEASPGWSEDIQDSGFYSLINIAKAIGKENLIREMHIIVVTNHLHEVTGDEPLCPGKATVLGPVNVIPQEFPGIRCRSVDVVLPEPGSVQEENLIEQLLEEVTTDSADRVIAYRGNSRWAQTFRPVRLDKTGEKPFKLKEKGVYLLTGGLGYLGFLLSEYLVKKVKARLVLTGRSALPPRVEWDQWLGAHDEEDPVSKKIKRITKLEEAGAEVLVLSADAADKEQMQLVMAEAEQTFGTGTVNGVIHLAGIMGGESFTGIQKIERSHCREQFHPKIGGLLVLEELLQDKEPDFCWLMSSMSNILGGLGFGAYAAANIFMDAYTKKHNRFNPRKWICVNWDGMEGIEVEEARIGFERILSLDKVDQVVFAGGGNLQERIDQWIKLKSLEQENQPIEGPLSSRKPRPDLLSPYVPPRDETERALVDIWQSLLGFEPLGSLDDFIELGGDSLKGIVMISTVHKELNAVVPLEEFFNKPTIEGLAEYIKYAEKGTYRAITPEEEKEYYPLSSAQKRLYILNQMDPRAVGYNLAATMVLEGKTDEGRLEEGFRRLIQRHEILRTSFHMIHGEPVQEVHGSVEFEIERLLGLDGSITPIINDFVGPFDLSKAPLMRVGLVKNGKQKYLLIVDMHHIVHDGISQTVFFDELMGFYAGEGLPAPKLQYKDYSAWQNRSIGTEAIKKQEEYWVNLFDGEIPVLNLPFDYVRPAIQGFEGDTIKFEIGPEKTGALKALAVAEESTLFIVLLSIYNVHLSKLSGQEDIIVGTPAAGRKHPDLQRILGVFLNTLALRNYPQGAKSFGSFVKETKETTLKAFGNQDYPFEDLVERVKVKRDLSRNPLFDVMLILHNQWDPQTATISRQTVKGVALKPYRYEKSTSEFDLNLIGMEEGDRLVFKLEYCTKLFKLETMQRFISYFNTIVSAVLENPGQTIADIEMIPLPEKRRLLYEFNDTDVAVPVEKTIHRLFEEQAAGTPDGAAVVGAARRAESAGQLQITYHELNKKADQLAQVLREKGVKSGSIVGIMVERSVEMIVGLLGILKSGAAYLPIDPVFPEERVKYMLAHSSSGILVSELSEVSKLSEEIEVVKLSELRRELPTHLTHLTHPTQPCYVIYTSGSTGSPKGVMVTHRSAVNFIAGMTGMIDFSPGKSILALTTISFDIFFLETLLPLTLGLKVVMADESRQTDPKLLADMIVMHEVYMMQVTPSRLKLFLDFSEDLVGLGGVKELMVGGEAFPVNLFARVKEKFSGKIYNMYGPTETTIWSSVKDLSGIQPEELTIGSPIANTQVYIVDKHMGIQPLGAAGELLIGGDGVAEGYLNNVELTAEKFVFSSYRSYRSYRAYSFYFSKKLYKTGDLARWLPNGEIEFLGRLDHQVKIRGFRIELEEIEEQLLNHENIEVAVVTAGTSPTGDKYLAAYMVCTDTAAPGRVPTNTELREYLSGRLPLYMVPSYFVHLESIPLTFNGKADRKALPEPDVSRSHPGSTYVAPETSNEKVIANLWQEVLQVENVGIHDNFFDLGGNSLKVIQMNRKLKETFGKDIPVAVMFRNLTVGFLVKYLGEDETNDRREEELIGNEALDKAKATYMNTIRKFKGE